MGQRKDPVGIRHGTEGALSGGRDHSQERPQLRRAAVQGNAAGRRTSISAWLSSSCEKADLRPLPTGVMIHGDSEQRLDPLPAPQVPRVEVIDELYAAVVEGRPPLHSGEWALATLEVCWAMLRSARQRKEVSSFNALTLACWDYDRTRALIDGSVVPDGIELVYLNQPVEETFFRMMRYREYDCSEMSLSSYCRFFERRIRRSSRSRFFHRASSGIRASSSPRRAASASQRSSRASASACPSTR